MLQHCRTALHMPRSAADAAAAAAAGCVPRQLQSRHHRQCSGAGALLLLLLLLGSGLAALDHYSLLFHQTSRASAPQSLHLCQALLLLLPIVQ
jgi:hypothetical protein